MQPWTLFFKLLLLLSFSHIKCLPSTFQIQTQLVFRCSGVVLVRKPPPHNYIVGETSWTGTLEHRNYHLGMEPVTETVI